MAAIAASFVPYRAFFTSRVPVTRDLLFYFYPVKTQLGTALRDGQVPWLDPTRWGGVSLLGSPGAAAFYPANLLFVAFSPGGAMKAWILLHAALAVAGFAAFSRRLGLAPPWAAVAGLVYALGGVSVSLVPFCSSHASMALLPWLLALALDLQADPGPRTAVRVAVPATLLLLASPPEYLLYALVIAGALLARKGPSFLRFLRWGMAAALLSFALAAPHLLPSFRMALASSRGTGGGIDPIVAGEKALLPARAVWRCSPTASWPTGRRSGRRPPIPTTPTSPRSRRAGSRSSLRSWVFRPRAPVASWRSLWWRAESAWLSARRARSGGVSRRSSPLSSLSAIPRSTSSWPPSA